MALSLAIETATASCSVALLDGRTVVAERHEIVGRGHAERLIPMIAELPGNGRAATIFVDCGPGSFTGVRVGLAAARALGLAWNARVLGFSSLALIAATSHDASETIAVAINGGHGELFVQRFGLRPLRAIGDFASLPPADAARTIEDEIVMGSGAASLVAARGAGQAREALPRAADLILLPPELAALPPTPLYGRAPDARPAA